MRTQATVAGLGAAAALAVIALSYQAPEGTQLFQSELMTAEDHEFIRYVAEYGKSYGTRAEFEFRQAQFKQTLAKIAEHNSENGTSTVGINQFSDKTEAEMKKMLGYKPEMKKLLTNPAMTVRIYHDASSAEVISTQGHKVSQARYLVKNPNMYYADEKMRVNAFLGEWLTHCLKVGRSIQAPEELLKI